jgi:protein involved in polysaccharide export with SLBB domain
MTRISGSLLLVIFFLLGGCSSHPKFKTEYETINDNLRSQDSLPESDMRQIKDIPKYPETKNHIAPGFLFHLHHPSDEKLRGRYRVSVDGILRLPYNINIDVTNQTYSEVREKFLKATERFYQRGVQDASFQLLRREYYVEVRGFVKNSGQYLVSRKESIDKIIDMAGGLKGGNLKSDFYAATIKQKNDSYSISLNQYFESNALNSHFTWTGGDTIFINLLNQEGFSSSIPTVSVLGGVMAPGRTLYHEGANLFYYLSKTGGVIPSLGYEEAYVMRRTPKGMETIQFNITNMDTIPVIKPNDVIMLNGDKRTVMDKVLDRAAQIGGILSTIALLIVAF